MITLPVNSLERFKSRRVANINLLLFQMMVQDYGLMENLSLTTGVFTAAE